MLTQPTPTPSERAANQRFCTAQQTLYIPVSGILFLPITNGPNFDGSYVIQILIGDSRMPSNLKERYFDFFVPSNNLEESILSDSNDYLIFFLVSCSLIKIKFHG
jgi:hypothetical protein